MIVPKSKFIRSSLVALAAGAVLALAGSPTSVVAAGVNARVMPVQKPE